MRFWYRWSTDTRQHILIRVSSWARVIVCIGTRQECIQYRNTNPTRTQEHYILCVEVV
jgi:hypothetical protein